jgi:hypothetical protein
VPLATALCKTVLLRMLNDSWAGRNPTKGCSAAWRRSLITAAWETWGDTEADVKISLKTYKLLGRFRSSMFLCSNKKVRFPQHTFCMQCFNTARLLCKSSMYLKSHLSLSHVSGGLKAPCARTLEPMHPSWIHKPLCRKEGPKTLYEQAEGMQIHVEYSGSQRDRALTSL